MFNRSAPPVLEETVWEVVVNPISRPGLVDRLRPDLESRLTKRPETQAFSWDTPLGTVQARLVSGTYRPGSPVRFSFAAQPAGNAKNSGGSKDDCPFPKITLPDDRIAERTDRLVGLDGPMRELLVHMRSRWDGKLNEPSVGACVPQFVRRYFKGSCPLYVAEGRPGTGKTVTIEGVADRYCREMGIAGTIFKVTTTVRGKGTVGDFSQQIHKAFETALRLPEEELKVLSVDEGDAIASHRRFEQQHQEEKAATASIIQALDGSAGVPRFVVLMSTNMPDSLDPALLRRATIINFYPPSPEHRAELLKRWLDPIDGRQLRRAVKASADMTAADIERALSRAWLWALSAGETLDVSTAIRCLAAAERTEDV